MDPSHVDQQDETEDVLNVSLLQINPRKQELLSLTMDLSDQELQSPYKFAIWYFPQ